jgi:hypothetical protein
VLRPLETKDRGTALKRRPAQLAGAFFLPTARRWEEKGFCQGHDVRSKNCPVAQNAGTKNKGAAGITTAAPHITG